MFQYSSAASAVHEISVRVVHGFVLIIIFHHQINSASDWLKRDHYLFCKKLTFDVRIACPSLTSHLLVFFRTEQKNRSGSTILLGKSKKKKKKNYNYLVLAKVFFPFPIR